MKVYCTPIKLACTSGRFTAASFLASNASNSITSMDYSDADKSVYFRFFEDNDAFSCVILTIKKSKSYVSASPVNQDFSLKTNGIGSNSISEANLMILNKNNLKGIYVHNEGSMRLGAFDSKLKSFYYSALRSKLTSKKRNEKFAIERLVDNATLMDKIKKYSFVDEINATFVNSTTAARYLNSSVYNKTKSVRVTMRTNNLSIQSRKAKDELVDYLQDLIKDQAQNISFKGKHSINTAGDTVGVIDKANSVENLEYDDYMKMLNGIQISAFLSSQLYIDMKQIIMSHSLLK
ncbi:hypothetical protein K2Y34_13310 [Cronobacter sakazakii]|uniref:hypothetical protein n=1 Tax=Cronobacter sakazakii TaxID=28141 RepID=UPI0021B66B9F|nr:hypothetical protein [Cronobacter sakazakii]UXD90056.1 hypothetical protein K2Y34_13310 [Cronobacter sakazakii]